MNDFTGWASKPERNDQIVKTYWTQLLDQLFRKQNHETEAQTKLRFQSRKWFEQWLAYPIQNPTKPRMLNAAVLSGQQGGGKDMVGRALMWAVYGERHYRLIGPSELNSDFNASYMAGVSFIHCQEITNQSNKRHFKELMKAFITGNKLQVNEKFEKAYYIDPVFNFYMTTNPENSIDLDGDDRRYFIWRIPDGIIQEWEGKKWTNDFHKVMQSPEGRAALHYHLLHQIDLTDFDPNAQPPVTEAKQFTQQFSTTEAESYVAKFAQEQRENNPNGVWRLEDIKKGTIFREKEFTVASRKYFAYLGRATVRIREKKVKTGLWVLKPTIDDTKHERFVTLEQAKERFEKARENKPIKGQDLDEKTKAAKANR